MHTSNLFNKPIEWLSKIFFCCSEYTIEYELYTFWFYINEYVVKFVIYTNNLLIIFIDNLANLWFIFHILPFYIF